MPIKPPGLTYGVEDTPSISAMIPLALQHIFLLFTVLVFPLMIVTLAHGSGAYVLQMIQAILLVTGIGTIVLSSKNKWFGSGSFVCMSYDPSSFSVSVMAAKIGGLPLLYTINYIQSLLQLVCADVIVRLRKFFPVEVAGLVIVMVGVSLLTTGVTNAIGGVDTIESLHLHPAACLVSFVSLIVMVGFTVWGGKRFSFYGLLAGLIVGLILSGFMGLFAHAHVFAGDKVFALPSFVGFHLSLLHWDYVLPIVIAVIAVSLKSMGNFVVADKINDAEWRRPDVKKAKRGLITTALGSLLSTVLGGLPMGTISANIGLSATSHATSRRIALPVGIVFIVLSFLPHFCEVFTLIPKPVVGAMLIYVVAAFLISGVQILLSRMMDTRKLFAIALPLIIGLAFEFIPQLRHDVTGHWHALVASPLTLATLLAIILNMFFQLGASRTAQTTMNLSDYQTVDLKYFMDKAGAGWGAMPSTIYRARKTVEEILVAIKSNATDKTVALDLLYDEQQLVGELVYTGKGMLLDLEHTILAMTSNQTDINALAIHAAEAHADAIDAFTAGDKQILRFTICQ